MTSGLEDKIIAYFDGELSDADGAELLHRVSVSPEIRTLFREHEMLREMARESANAVTISPEIETSLFSRIEALAEKPIREKAVWVFSRRTALVSALALILISGSVGYLVPKLFSGSSQNLQNSRSDQQNLSSSIIQPTPQVQSFPNSSAFHTNLIGISHISEAPRNGTPAETNDTYSNGTEDISVNKSDIAIIDKTPLMEGIHSVAPRMADIHSGIGERISPFERPELQQDSRSLFEASLQTSSGFTYPADASPIKPFADQRFSFGYHISENNLIGIRIASGLYQQLGSISQSSLGGIEVLSRTIETKRNFSEEIYVSHLIPITIAAPFFLEFSLDGGIIPNGYTYGAEAGVRIPLSESVMFDAAFALTRVHSNALTSDQILTSTNATTPILLQSADIHNTLNGRLHYGLLYRF
jgi:hypothetical protein